VPATREKLLLDEQRQSLQAAQTPTFQARFSDPTTLTISATNLKTCLVRWHRLDVEPLFSRAPFSTTEAKQITHVRADHEQEIIMMPNGSATAVVPDNLRQQAVAVEVLAGGQRQMLNTFAHALDIRLSPSSGQILVQHADTGKPLPITYIKVYAEHNSGAISFYKDGYTDLRGRFDYASLGTGAAHGVQRFALFISHEQAGSTVREIGPP
jgi:hypothetical protein